MNSSPGYRCHYEAWRQHQAELRRFLAHRAGSAAVADDLLQEVFLKALLQGSAFCNLDNPRAWLFHIARNLLIDRLRLTREELPLPDDLCAEAAPALEAVDLLSQCLPRVLSEIPAQDREAILLCDMRGMTQKDYARYLGLTLPAAKSRVQRARLRLRAQLAAACQVSFDAAGKVCCFVMRPPLALAAAPQELDESHAGEHRADKDQSWRKAGADQNDRRSRADAGKPPADAEGQAAADQASVDSPRRRQLHRQAEQRTRAFAGQGEGGESDGDRPAHDECQRGIPSPGKVEKAQHLRRVGHSRDDQAKPEDESRGQGKKNIHGMGSG
jgi:RNA polymerase sigma-70 factor (ECF subfamily)